MFFLLCFGVLAVTRFRLEGETFDSATGKELYSSGDAVPSFTHLCGISISGGRVFVTTFDSNVYALA